MKMTLLITTLLLFTYNLKLKAQGLPYNQEFQVNTFTNDWQSSPSVSSLADGGYVICWNSFGQDGSLGGVYGQLFESDGSNRSQEFQVNTYTSSYQGDPSVSSLTDGGFVVCWQSLGQDGSGYGIYSQIFNIDGSKHGTEFRINTYSLREQFDPNVANLMDGGFVVSWTSQVGTGREIYGQLFNNDGSMRGTEFQVTTYSKYDQVESCVSNLTDEGFVVCWRSMHQDGSWGGIYGQLFYNDGSTLGNEFRVNTFTHDSQVSPTVTNLVDGGFVVCWESWGQTGSGFGVYGQLFNSDRLGRGDEFQVNTYTSSSKDKPSVTNLSNGGFVVCWESSGQDGSSDGIYGQLYNGDGSLYGSEFQVNTYTKSSQSSPSVASLNDGVFVVSWESYGQDGSGSGVYAKYYLQEAINHPLLSFPLLEPIYDSTVNTTRPTFSWYQASDLRINLPWELEYSLYLSENEEFSNPHIIPAIYDTTSTVDSLTPGTLYFWKVLAKNIEGDSLWSSETSAFFVSHDAVTAIEDIQESPKSFTLYQNYPNPFNPETTIKYSLPAGQSIYHVKVKIYNALGQLIEILVDANQTAGLYTVKWNAGNVPSGIYFAVIKAGQFSATQKMLLLR